MATIATRLGQDNGTGDAYALFLTKYAGEILAVFERKTSARNMFSMRNISNGDSATFPAFSRAIAAYHTAGQDILDETNNLLTEFGVSERLINVDQLLQSSCFVDKLDEMINHWEVRSGFTDQLGQALARKEDEQLYQLSVLASRASSTVTDAPGVHGGGGGSGGSVGSTGGATSSATLIGLIYEAAEALDVLDIPSEDRFCPLVPSLYYNLIADTSGGVTDAVNKDFTTENGGFDSGVVKQVAGVQIVKTNSFPFNGGVIATETGDRNTYGGDYTTTVATVFHKSAVGSVKMADMTVESDYMVRFQGTLFVSKMAVGHGILRPEASVEIIDTSLS